MKLYDYCLYLYFVTSSTSKQIIFVSVHKSGHRIGGCHIVGPQISVGGEMHNCQERDRRRKSHTKLKAVLSVVVLGKNTVHHTYKYSSILYVLFIHKTMGEWLALKIIKIDIKILDQPCNWTHQGRNWFSVSRNWREFYYY